MSLYFKMAEEEKEDTCHEYNDCSICPLAIHHDLLTKVKHVCARDMTEDEVNKELENSAYRDPLVGCDKSMLDAYENGIK